LTLTFYDLVMNDADFMMLTFFFGKLLQVGSTEHTEHKSNSVRSVPLCSITLKLNRVE